MNENETTTPNKCPVEVKAEGRKIVITFFDDAERTVEAALSVQESRQLVDRLLQVAGHVEDEERRRLFYDHPLQAVAMICGLTA